MKKILLVLAVVSAFSGMPTIAHADVSVGVNVPGFSMRIGDRDPRGYYWDGGDWRPPGWWSHHRRDRGRWVYYEPVPPPPPPRYWRHDPYWREGPPPRYWHDGPPGRWREGPPPGRW